jgi:hypothetical protein
LPKAIKEGFLCPIKAQTIPLKLDLTGVSIQAGDFRAADIGTALDPYLYQIADEMVKCCMDRKTVVFLPLIKTSQKFRAILESKGFAAAEVNGDSRDRSEILADFDAGKYNVLCNSMLLTEGWDSRRWTASWSFGRQRSAAYTVRWSAAVPAYTREKTISYCLTSSGTPKSMSYAIRRILFASLKK